MGTASPSKLECIRFGVFELDLRSRELRKQGVRVKLQEQPFQVLQVLLERPGEVVTREELRQRIWSSDTFVDFEGGMYNAVKKLREALGDTADTPRFIETLPRRGYRFIGAVSGNADAAPTGQESPKLARENGSAVSRRGLRIGLGAGLAIGVLLIALLGLLGAGFFNLLKRDLPALLSSGTFLLGMLSSAAFSLYPIVLPAVNRANSLTINNASASQYGLTVGLIWWSIGIVLAVIYFTITYRRFSGKVTAMSSQGY